MFRAAEVHQSAAEQRREVARTEMAALPREAVQPVLPAHLEAEVHPAREVRPVAAENPQMEENPELAERREKADRRTEGMRRRVVGARLEPATARASVIPIFSPSMDSNTTSRRGASSR